MVTTEPRVSAGASGTLQGLSRHVAGGDLPSREAREILRTRSVIRRCSLFAYFIPLATPQFAADADPIAAKSTGAIVEAFVLLQWYARNHTLACILPALFIAGAITTFLSKESVLKHLGPNNDCSSCCGQGEDSCDA